MADGFLKRMRSRQHDDSSNVPHSASPPEIAEPVRGHLAFTLAVHRAVDPDPLCNTCWSPFSVASALGLVATGAHGATEHELTNLLGGSALDVGGLLAPAGRAGEDESTIAVANTLWTDASIEVLPSFVSELASWAHGTVRPAPFHTAPEQARQSINADVAGTTRGLIPELIKTGMVTRDTRAALVNALYVKCVWESPFERDATHPEPFHTPGGPVPVPTMVRTSWLGYARRDGWQVMSIEAAGGVQAVVLLPDGDLGTAEARLDAELLGRLLGAPVPTRVTLFLPKLRVSMNAELREVLTGLGVTTLFTDAADLSGISTSPLKVSTVVHESVLELDELGFEGAAATAALIGLGSAPPPDPPPVVRIDRPFLLVIRHARTGVLYFLARIADPS